MLFGISFCGRGARVRKTPPPHFNWRLLLAILAAGVFVALLFIAPQWLLVLLVLILSGALAALVLLPRR